MSQSSMEFKGHPVRETSYKGRRIRYVAGQLFVKLKAPYRDNNEFGILRFLPEEASIQKPPNKLGWVVVDLPEDVDVMAIIDRLKDHKEVESAELHLLESAL
jgi:hypothetical protein